jgi:hypothetical protein
MSQQIVCAVLKTTPRPHQIIRPENVELCSKKGRRMVSQRRLCLFGTLFVCWNFICLELYLFGMLFVWHVLCLVNGRLEIRYFGSQAGTREVFKIFICLMSRKNCNPELSTEAGLRAQLGEASHGHDGRLGSGRSDYRLRGRLWR